MSDTPRTEKFWLEDEWVNNTWRNKYEAMMNLARQLERENNALKAGEHLLFSQRLVPQLQAQNATLIKFLEKLVEAKNLPGITVAELSEYAQRAIDAARKEAQP